MDTTIKVTSIHIVAALVAAIISTALTVGWVGFKNDIFAGFVVNSVKKWLEMKFLDFLNGYGMELHHFSLHGLFHTQSL